MECQRLSRRDLIRIGIGLMPCPLIAACSNTAAPESDGAPSPDVAVMVRGNVIEVDTTRVPAWSTPGPDARAVVFLSVQLIVVRRGTADYLALSSVCPHAGCGVSVVQPPRLVCPCHGSEFDFGGRRLAGPAPSGLVTLPSTFDDVTGRLQVSRTG